MQLFVTKKFKRPEGFKKPLQRYQHAFGICTERREKAGQLFVIAQRRKSDACAEIALLLIKILQFRSRFAWAISNLIALLRWNLFTYRDLWLWIDRPFDTPQQSPPAQLEFFDLDSIQSA